MAGGCLCIPLTGSVSCLVDSGISTDEKMPKVDYSTSFPLNHELQFTNTLGRALPLIAWDSMPEAARKGLEYANFGFAVVPFKDGTFQGHLAAAALQF
ncbi:hypothetical protein GB937_009950 [Aspergillus fischeri]|nr:hypothetical protein GB937_009950 [Aspergillus fischeri]